MPGSVRLCHSIPDWAGGAHMETVDKVLALLSAVLVGFVQSDSGKITASSLKLLVYILFNEDKIELK